MSGFVDTITYWSKGNRDQYGQVSFGSPTELNGRWEQKNELFINSQGREQLASDIVYLESSVDIEGMVYLGTSISTTPRSVTGAKEIEAISMIKNIGGTKSLYKVWL